MVALGGHGASSAESGSESDESRDAEKRAPRAKREKFAPPQRGGASGAEKESSGLDALVMATKALLAQGESTQALLQKVLKPEVPSAFGAADTAALEAAARLAGGPPLRLAKERQRERGREDREEDAGRGAARSPREEADGRRGRDRSERGSRRSGRKEVLSSSESDSDSGKERGGSGGVGRGIRRLRKLQKKFEKNPGRRWKHVVREARSAGCSSLEQYLEQCSGCTRDRHTLYMATLFARIGEAASQGNAGEAAGLAASGVIYLDQVSNDGNVEMAWHLSLSQEPSYLRRHTETPASRAWPNAQQRKKLLARAQFSQLAEQEVMEAALAAGANWQELRKKVEEQGVAT